MGLAAPKQRMKLSHDPNNTRWTSDTSSFGHKIMASQGWKPGEYLGAKDAPHAEFHTAANASHIRVSIKDDNLGLGAKIGSGVGHGECTGLDAFKNLLGRLNGKDEDEIEKEQKSREDLKRAIYAEQRWGSIRFVQGGFLVGDKIQLLIDGEAERVRKLAAGDAASSSNDSSDSSDSTDSDESQRAVVEKTKKSKKRKLEELNEVPEVIAIKVKKSKKQKRKSGASREDAIGAGDAIEDVKMSKKKTKRRRDADVEAEDEEDDAWIKQRKKEKKHKKDRKEKNKNKERLKAVLEDDSRKESKKKSKRDKSKGEAVSTTESEEPSRSTTKDSTPTIPLEGNSGRSTPMMQGRHAVRARNIAQKRLASMDVTSLNQIFMIKSQT